MPAYYVALVKQDGNWTQQFGAYTKATVKAELPELAKSFNVLRKDVKMIECPHDDLFCIEACVESFNKGIKIEDPRVRFDRFRPQIMGVYSSYQQGNISVTELCEKFTAMGYTIVKLNDLELYDDYVGCHLIRTLSIFGPY